MNTMEYALSTLNETYQHISVNIDMLTVWYESWRTVLPSGYFCGGFLYSRPFQFFFFCSWFFCLSHHSSGFLFFSHSFILSPVYTWVADIEEVSITGNINLIKSVIFLLLLFLKKKLNLGLKVKVDRLSVLKFYWLAD